MRWYNSVISSSPVDGIIWQPHNLTEHLSPSLCWSPVSGTHLSPWNLLPGSFPSEWHHIIPCLDSSFQWWTTSQFTPRWQPLLGQAWMRATEVATPSLWSLRTGPRSCWTLLALLFLLCDPQVSAGCQAKDWWSRANGWAQGPKYSSSVLF